MNSVLRSDGVFLLERDIRRRGAKSVYPEKTCRDLLTVTGCIDFLVVWITHGFDTKSSKGGDTRRFI